ncbi:MAG: tRNA-binding protein [Bacteroidales bacterium]|nr:tRNA-binding protein [Bacteroidales bacterium]MBN2758749.1 tRNA-binding protein [Bacteroidales bacterium]
MDKINWQDFERVELRAGTIINAENFPEAKKPAYKLTIDFGENIGIKKSSAQITDLYAINELIDKQIIAVVNFPAKQIGNFLSECLVCGFYNENNSVVLAVPEKKIENGSKLG